MMVGPFFVYMLSYPSMIHQLTKASRKRVQQISILRNVSDLIDAPGWPMGRTSRIVTVIEGVEAIEVTTNDREGNPTETRYQVRGEKYETLRQAMEAAKGIGER